MITVCLIIVVSLVVGAIVIRRVMQDQEQEAKVLEEDTIVRDLNYQARREQAYQRQYDSLVVE